MKITALFSSMGLSLALVTFSGLNVLAQSSSATAGHEMGRNQSSHSTANGMSATDKEFVKQAARGGVAEVELGKLASQKASNPEVKKFAERMVNDHTQANNELKEIAKSKNITLPDSMNAKDRAAKEKLSSLSGEQFDKAYMSDMVKDHTKDVTDFQKESSSAQDPAVKHFATQTLPKLEDHLKQAKNLEPKLTAQK